MAGSPGAGQRAPEPTGAGPRIDARQPARRSRPALLLEVGHRPGDQPASPGAARAAGDRCWRGDARAGGDGIRPVPDPRRGGPARHHRHASHGAGLRVAAPRQLLRFDQERDPDFAHHDRRRGHPKSGRHGVGAAGGGPAHGGDRPGRTLLSQLAAYGDRDSHSGLLRWRHGPRLHQAAAVVPRARQAQRRIDRAVGRDPRRHPHRQSVPRRAGGAAGLHAWRSLQAR